MFAEYYCFTESHAGGTKVKVNALSSKHNYTYLESENEVSA